jgi:hypothetical protein
MAPVGEFPDEVGAVDDGTASKETLAEESHPTVGGGAIVDVELEHGGDAVAPFLELVVKFPDDGREPRVMDASAGVFGIE